MKTWWAAGCAFVILAIVGCTTMHDRPVVGVATAVEDAFDATTSSLAVAYSSLIANVGELNLRSPRATLMQAKEQTVALERKLSELGELTDRQRLERDVLRAQIDRIDIALNAKSLRRDWEAAIQRAARKTELTAAEIDRHRARLLETSEEFRALDEARAAIERRYTDATNQLAELMDRHARHIANGNGP